MYARVEEVRSQWIMDDSEVRACVYVPSVDGDTKPSKRAIIEP